MKNYKTIFSVFLLLLVGATSVFGQQRLKFSIVSFEADNFDMTARDDRHKKVDGSGSLYAIIKVIGDTPNDDLKEYQFNFGNMNHMVEEHDGKLWVFVQKNAKIVTISRKGYATIDRYDLHTTIEAGKTYVMHISAQGPVVQHSILQFSVNPANVGAIVKVKRESDSGDYQLWGTVDASGGIAKRLEVDTYLYEVIAEYYDRTEGRITLNSSETKHVEKVVLTPNFGTLVVEDKYGIGGAEIYVNDRRIGTVPYTSSERWAVRDDYRIMVSKDMYKTYSGTFCIRKGETTRLAPLLEADFAQTTITTGNNAEIWLEGEHKGNGTWTGALRSGVYQVECRMDRHRTTQRTITVTANQSETFTIDTPTPIAGSIYISSSPLGAAIKVDGKDYGTTPNEIKDIPIGQHNVLLSLSGYGEVQSAVEVKENETVEVDLELNDESKIATKIGKEGNTFTVKGVTYVMKPVDGGTFQMGASEQGSDAWDDEKPVHSVTLNSYYIGQTEVTQALWQTVMGSNPSKIKGNNLPVEMVSWEECQTFINKLNQLTDQKFRLPTEAEWEYAARGGKNSKGYKYSGSNTLDDVAWYTDNSDSQTHPVAMKQANELGLYDMSGNVWEWCQDWKGDYPSSSQTNPTGSTSGSFRVSRGGSWGSNVRICRVSVRDGFIPSNRYDNLGFRLALSE